VCRIYECLFDRRRLFYSVIYYQQYLDRAYTSLINVEGSELDCNHYIV
jgi:hypothetical protein